jgi:hypothetical protein
MRLITISQQQLILRLQRVRKHLKRQQSPVLLKMQQESITTPVAMAVLVAQVQQGIAQAVAIL